MGRSPVRGPVPVRARGASAASSANCASTREQRVGKFGARLVYRHAGAGDHCIDLRGSLGERRRSPMMRNRRRGFSQADDHRFGHCHADLGGAAFDRGDAQLPGPGPHRPHRGQDRRAGHVAASADDQDAALGFLVAIDDRRQRMRVERVRIDPFAHLVPAIASGAEVFGAPSASSGAPWFHRSRSGMHSPCAPGSKS